MGNGGKTLNNILLDSCNKCVLLDAGVIDALSHKSDHRCLYACFKMQAKVKRRRQRVRKASSSRALIDDPKVRAAYHTELSLNIAAESVHADELVNVVVEAAGKAQRGMESASCHGSSNYHFVEL